MSDETEKPYIPRPRAADDFDEINKRIIINQAEAEKLRGYCKIRDPESKRRGENYRCWCYVLAQRDGKAGSYSCPPLEGNT